MPQHYNIPRKIGRRVSPAGKEVIRSKFKPTLMSPKAASLAAREHRDSGPMVLTDDEIKAFERKARKSHDSPPDAVKMYGEGHWKPFSAGKKPF